MIEKKAYQKRSLATNKLLQYIEEFQEIPISQLLCVLTSKIGEDNPFPLSTGHSSFDAALLGCKHVLLAHAQLFVYQNL